MKTVSVYTLLPKIVPLVTGCNDDLAKLILADAARTFARESDIVIETRGYAENENAPEYGRMPEFALDAEHFLPHHFISRTEDAATKRVYVTYSLLPTADIMPEAVVVRHYEAITSQALFQLYSMPGKPWTASDMAQLYLQKYRIALGDAMRDNNTGGAVFDQYMICCEPGETGFIGAQNVNATIIGTDTSDGNITPNTVLAGYDGYAKGEKITGNIPTVTPALNKNVFTVPMGYVGSPVVMSIPEATATLNKNTVNVSTGYVPENQSLTVPEMIPVNDGEYVTVPVGYNATEQKFKVSSGSGVEIDFVTAGSADILSGKIGTDKEGNPVYGSIQTVTATLSENVATIPKGYIAQAQTLTVANAQAPTVSGNVVTIYKGYHANQTTATVPKATSSVSGNVVTIPAGYHDATTKTVAEMTEPSVSGNVVTIPVGYNKTQKTKTIAEAGQNTVSGNVVTTPVGYIKSERKTTVGTAKGAETITPGTADRTIAAGTYLTGALTVKGDADLISENIAEGKEIFGIAGSFKGGSSMDFYKCAAVYGPRKVECYVISGCPTAAANGNYALTENTTTNGMENFPVYYSGAYYYYYNPSDMMWCIGADYNSYDWLYYGEGDYWSDNNWDGVPGMNGRKAQVTLDADVPKTWDGYKAILADGVYDFEKTLTTGMSYGEAFTPVVNKIYNADCSVAISALNTSKPDDYVFFNALNSADGWDMVGAEIVQDGSRSVFSTNGGSDYAVITENPGVPLQSSPRTMSHWFRRTGSNGSAWCGVGYGTSGGNSRYTWGLRDEYSIFTLWADDNFQSSSGRITDDKWHHFVTTYDGIDKVVQYVDGEKIWEWSTGTTNTSWQYIHIGDPWESYACVGHYADLYIYDRILNDDEIIKLFNARTVDND